MTTFNTGNPIGSTAVKDLYDNTENLDVLVNDRTRRQHEDRLGVPRKTWYGMEQDFQDFLVNSGYQQIGDYGPGLDIAARNQVFWKDGELYRAGASLELPYTTTGVWEDEEDLFVVVGDQVLRIDLNNQDDPEKGAALVGYRGSNVRDALDVIFSSVNVLSYIPKEEHEAIRNRTSSYDCTADINEALRENGSVFFPRGRYMVSPGIVANDGNILHGEGVGTWIELLPQFIATGGAMLVNAGYDDRPRFTAAGNIAVMDMVWDDRGDLDTTNSSGSVNTIMIAHADNVLVERCVFPNHKLHAVDLIGCSNAVISGCLARNGKGSAFQIDSAAPGTNSGVYGDNTECRNVKVVDNVIESPCYDPDNQQGFVGGIHVHRTGHRWIYIERNRIQGPFQGIFIDPNVTVNDVIIRKNIVLGRKMDGTTTNVHPGDHHYGIRGLCKSTDILVEKNIIEYWENGAILFTHSTSPLSYSDNTKVIGNNIRNISGGSGISLVNHRDALISDNFVNVVEGAVGGITLNGADQGIVSKNTIRGQGPAAIDHGVKVVSAGVVLNKFNVSDNNILGVNTSVITSDGVDVLVYGNINTTIGSPVNDFGSGTNRSWVSVTSQRVMGEWYTNNTNREIEVDVTFSGGTGNVTPVEVRNQKGVVVGLGIRPSGGTASGVHFTVPIGHSYRTITGHLSWSELR